MYGWLWRKLPGGFVGKFASMSLLAAAALAVLFLVVFPWVEPRLPWNDVTVDSPSIGTAVPSVSPSASPAASLSPSPSALPGG